MRQEHGKYYRPLTLASALGTALAAGVLYFETTDGAEWYEVASGVGTNVLQCFLFAKVSIEYLVDLINNKEYGKAKAALIVMGAAGLYIPQISISVLDSPYGTAFTAFAGTATLFAGASFNAFAVKKLAGFLVQLKNLLTQDVPFHLRHATGYATPEEINFYRDRSMLVNNLSMIEERLRFAPLSDAVLLNDSDFFTTSLYLANTVTPTCSTVNPVLWYLAKGMQYLLGFTTAMVLLNGAIGYTCTTTKDIIRHTKVSPALATVSGNVLMSGQYILSFAGAFALVFAVMNLCMNLIQYRVLPNDLRVGGKLGTAASILSPFLATFIASFSGVTSRKLVGNCAATPLKALLYPGTATVVDWAARVFNAIFGKYALDDIKTDCVLHYGTSAAIQKDRAFLALLHKQQTLRAGIKAASSPEKLHEVLTESLTPREITQLLSPMLFAHPRDRAEQALEDPLMRSAMAAQ